MKKKLRLSLLLKIVNNLFERELNNKISSIDLTRTQCSVLGYLNRNRDKEINPCHIEKEFNLKKPTVTGILKRLEEKGFVLIEQSKTDKRYKHIKLTSKNDEVDKIMRKNLIECEKVLYEGLSEDDKKELYRILEKMMDNLLANNNQ
ncbi:MarR family transcriptional regulator [Clostridium sp. SM-530-WT-3G]|uniref:MarR family winged helix-turn-helix transcriptional regulator n=1 Tax=Clostridium sp. SM-530-WT-3G TaxID=2725303 RepID=UPI00145F54AC|nr:MarR family transcriptional regulator [Clostridium sp. SM-530-WT-3G]NME83826.1 MarR family transcriptional regulator [Clostridium sp. SM-530-WT-3G]